MTKRSNPAYKFGRPALVCVPTGETVILNGKPRAIVKLMYDVHEQYQPYAAIVA